MEKDTTFSEVAAQWKADKKQYVKKSTYAAYCLLIQSHLIPELGERTDIREEDVQGLVNRKLAAGLSQKTVRDVLVVLKMILRFGAKHGLQELHQIDIVFPTERERQDVEVPYHHKPAPADDLRQGALYLPQSWNLHLPQRRSSYRRSLRPAVG